MTSSMVSKTPIHNLDDDSLLQIFNFYRLEDEDHWHLRLGWLKLIQACRRWRNLISDSWSHLDMRLLLTNDSLSINALSHLPPLPLVIDYSDRTKTIAQKDEDNIHFGLQQHGRVRQVVLLAPSSSLHMWLELMNKPFPILRDLSLSSTITDSREKSLVLPELFQAPDLRRLSLRGIGLPKGFSLLSSTIALSTLSLTHIRESCYFPPGHLVAQLQGLPHLEELSVGFAIPIPPPSSEGELLSTPIPPATLPTLRKLTFHGEDVYLDDLVSQINTPVLERLSLSLLLDLDFTLVNLPKFIHRTEGIGCLVARVIFNKGGASIDAGNYEQRAIGALSFHINCKPLDWQINSATQVCSALWRVLSTVEELTLESDWEDRLDSIVWHELLLPFVGVKKLHIGSSLTFKLSQSLESVAGGLVLELLPELQELEVHLKMFHSKNVFSFFVETRESVARPVHLSVPSQQSIRPNKMPFVSEDGLKSRLWDLARSNSIRLNELDFVINGRPIDIWELHRTVFSRCGFESVSTHDEWPFIGVALGFPSVAGRDAGQPPRCGSVIAHRLQLLYNDVLRYFDQLYIHIIVAHPHQPTEADYQALLINVTLESIMNHDAMNLLPRFSHVTGADLEAHHVPRHVITFVERNREYLQRAAQDQSELNAGLTKNPYLDNLSGSTQSMQIRRLTQEDAISAKRLVIEKKRMAFSYVSDFNEVADYPPIPESDKQEYHRDLERLDQLLSNIEKYIHFAFAAMKKEDIVERMFTMMASVKFQLEELKKPNPRIVLALHTIRGMIQEADNMDKRLKAVIQRTQGYQMPPGGVPSAPQPPPQPPSVVGNALFAPPGPLTAPPAPVSRPPHAPLQPAHRKKLSQAQATPMPPPIPTAAATPGFTSPSSQTPKSSKGKPKRKPPTRRNGSKRENGVETPTAAHSIAPTPSSSKPADAKGGGKRVHSDDDDTASDAPRLGVSSAPSPKRVKTKQGDH